MWIRADFFAITAQRGENRAFALHNVKAAQARQVRLWITP
jgi:hypothetical protein